jgi:hypothetical protein
LSVDAVVLQNVARCDETESPGLEPMKIPASPPKMVLLMMRKVVVPKAITPLASVS